MNLPSHGLGKSYGLGFLLMEKRLLDYEHYLAASMSGFQLMMSHCGQMERKALTDGYAELITVVQINEVLQAGSRALAANRTKTKLRRLLEFHDRSNPLFLFHDFQGSCQCLSPNRIQGSVHPIRSCRSHSIHESTAIADRYDSQ